MCDASLHNIQDLQISDTSQGWSIFAYGFSNLHKVQSSLGWVGGLKNVGCVKYTMKNRIFVLEQFLSLSVFKFILFSINEYRIGAYLPDLMTPVETYHFLTPYIHIFFPYLCKLRSGWVGQSKFALWANWKNRTQKWTTPFCFRA